MRSTIIILLSLLFSFIPLYGKSIIVVDSVTRQPLPSTTIFDREGKAICLTNNKGKLPYISPDNFPITFRYLGFNEKTLTSLPNDTIFLTELSTELPEVLIETRQNKVLHILAYSREYSTLSTYTDTIFLFREKMVDYVITPDPKAKFKGWKSPRVLKSKSYYRFTNGQGLDSVSNLCNHHFSWSDWIGIVPSPTLPTAIKNVESGSDTIMGKYSPTEIWLRNNGKVTVDINVLADSKSRKWVSDLSVFFKEYLDFENFRLRYNYGNVSGDSIDITDLSGYSFSIESNGRGRDMFQFNKKNESFFVNTFGEVYILDKEYITVKEAKAWTDRKFKSYDFDIIEPAEAPDLQPAILSLIGRVNAIDHDGVRLDITPDHRLVGRNVKKQNFGQRALQLLKDVTGISTIRSNRKFNKNWKETKKKIVENNQENTSIFIDSNAPTLE